VILNVGEEQSGSIHPFYPPLWHLSYYALPKINALALE
jgi:hypothetical protein